MANVNWREFVSRYLPFFQWAMVGALATEALIESATDHGVMMALNCILLGMYIGALLFGFLFDRTKEITTIQSETLSQQDIIIHKQTELMDACLRLVRDQEVQHRATRH